MCIFRHFYKASPSKNLWSPISLSRPCLLYGHPITSQLLSPTTTTNAQNHLVLPTRRRGGKRRRRRRRRSPRPKKSSLMATARHKEGERIDWRKRRDSTINEVKKVQKHVLPQKCTYKVSVGKTSLGRYLRAYKAVESRQAQKGEERLATTQFRISLSSPPSSLLPPPSSPRGECCSLATTTEKRGRRGVGDFPFFRERSCFRVFWGTVWRRSFMREEIPRRR